MKRLLLGFALVLFAATSFTANCSSAPPDFIRIALPERNVPSAPEVATLKIDNDKSSVDLGGVSFMHSGAIHIPYIQTSSSLRVVVECNWNSTDHKLRLTFTGHAGSKRTEFVDNPASSNSIEFVFVGLNKDEYSLEADVVDRAGNVVANKGLYDRTNRIGIGDIITAIGDSLTEGFYGVGVDASSITNWFETSPTLVSSDQRNFPQFGPRGDIKNFPFHYKKSWMPELNDLLSQRLGYPVFIINEGSGGITAQSYLNLMATPAWEQRQLNLKPNRWLIHLGVNDALGKTPLETYLSNMRLLVDRLKEKYGATSERIFIAKPSYVHMPNTPETDKLMQKYHVGLDLMTARNCLSLGPDFYKFFKKNYQAYYQQPASVFPPSGGLDFVHPNVSGISKMAELWANEVSQMRNSCFQQLNATREVDLMSRIINITHGDQSCEEC